MLLKEEIVINGGILEAKIKLEELVKKYQLRQSKYESNVYKNSSMKVIYEWMQKKIFIYTSTSNN